MVDSLLSLANGQFVEDATSEKSPWIDQTLQVELPLLLRFQFPQIDPLIEFGELASERMGIMIQDLLDHDGWPRADCLGMFGPLLCSWARCFAIIRRLRMEFHPDAESQLEWAVRQFLRLLRSDRSLVFSGFENPEPVSKDCWKLLLSLSQDLDDRSLANRCRKKKKRATPEDDPPPSSVSEWGESGLLQSAWAKGTPKIGFDYSSRSFAVELGASQPLVQGQVIPRIRRDGKPLEPQQDFQIVCSQHDDDLDYIEFEMQLSDMIVLNRQLLLSRDDHFLIMADCVTSVVPCRIDYECDWSLAPGIKCMAETETREMYLRDSKIRSLVLPLALPEWKVAVGTGRFEPTGSGFRLSQASQGMGLYAPLFFDLSSRRSKRKRTWRRLTVAENMRPVPPDIAVAFRIQIHKQQWLLYRAVGGKGNRTFLGENFIGEFVFSRFDSEGTVTELLRIE